VNPSSAVPSARALTVAAVARRLNVCEATVYRALRRGELPYIRIGRAIRIPSAALEVVNHGSLAAPNERQARELAELDRLLDPKEST